MHKILTKNIVASTFGLVACYASILPSFAMASEADVTHAIDKAKILAPTITFNVRVSKDEVEVATYKNPKAVDKDCKIEAVLIAKAVMDLSPGEVSRVTVYFYSSSALSRYKSLTVTAGDVKAFAAGAIGQDELLTSLKINEGTTADPNKRVADYLSEARTVKNRQVSSSIEGDTVQVIATSKSGATPFEIVFDALSLSDKAFEAAQPQVTKARVILKDPDSKNTNTVQFGRADVPRLYTALQDAVREVKIEQKTAAAQNGEIQNIDPAKYQIVEGPMAEERKALLARLDNLIKGGVNIGKQPLSDFAAIEMAAQAGDEAKAKELYDKLSILVGKFEENLKNAKDYKPQSPKVSTTGASEASKSKANAAGGGSLDIDSVGDTNLLKSRFLANPDAYVADMEAKLSARTKTHNAEDHPNFTRILSFAVQTLNDAGRKTEAAKFQARLDAINARK
ncbi:MAG: hypothetical protein K2X70_04940 [Candidatus Obscuribacterales bacterium]|nr:hypothetical protein [Candidatus Obscuribacterales bacterium]